MVNIEYFLTEIRNKARLSALSTSFLTLYWRSYCNKAKK